MFEWISIKNGKKVLNKFFLNTNFKGNLLKSLWINIWRLIAIIENLLRVSGPIFFYTYPNIKSLNTDEQV